MSRPTRLLDRVAVASADQVIRGYSTSFGWATRLLGPAVAGPVRTVYALVRVADEIVDEPDPTWPTADRAVALTRLREDVAHALRTGHGGGNLVVHAFARTARRFGIADDLIGPFFDSMAADLRVSEHDGDSLATYVHGSAEVVGLMCLRIFVDGDDATYERLRPGAQRLGAAFQKVNFLRDLAHDHTALGRTYLPGSAPEELTDAGRDTLVADIQADLDAAWPAVLALPRSSRVGVAAAHGLFSELNRRLRTTPVATLRTTRVRVPDPVKAVVVLRALRAGSGR